MDLVVKAAFSNGGKGVISLGNVPIEDALTEAGKYLLAGAITVEILRYGSLEAPQEPDDFGIPSPF